MQVLLANLQAGRFSRVNPLVQQCNPGTSDKDLASKLEQIFYRVVRLKTKCLKLRIHIRDQDQIERVDGGGGGGRKKVKRIEV